MPWRKIKEQNPTCAGKSFSEREEEGETAIVRMPEGTYYILRRPRTLKDTCGCYRSEPRVIQSYTFCSVFLTQKMLSAGLSLRWQNWVVPRQQRKKKKKKERFLQSGRISPAITNIPAFKKAGLEFCSLTKQFSLLQERLICNQEVQLGKEHAIDPSRFYCIYSRRADTIKSLWLLPKLVPIFEAGMFGMLERIRWGGTVFSLENTLLARNQQCLQQCFTTMATCKDVWTSTPTIPQAQACWQGNSGD